uniref:DUF6598 domain-containing protein n=1 Tax=Oryza meridionalis TaxID=40149 RepID=A0A0E0EF81_9ORYZ
MTEIPHAATARLFPLTPAAAQMRILRRFPRLLRRSNAAARSPAPMHRLISSPSLMASAAASWCWWSPLLARGGPVVRRVSRFPWEPRNMTTISRVKGDESYRRLPSQEKKHTAITQGMKTIDTRGTILEARAGDEKSNRDAASSEVSYIKYDVLGQSAKQDGCDEDDRRSETEEHVEEDEVLDPEEYTVNNILPKSRHRDGSIYRDIMDTPWKREFHIADRNETRLEAMKFSNPTDCVIRRNGTCMSHYHRCMLQILSLELAKITLYDGSIELYGYIAVRDDLDPLHNYIVNCSRDDPIIVEQALHARSTAFTVSEMWFLPMTDPVTVAPLSCCCPVAGSPEARVVEASESCAVPCDYEVPLMPEITVPADCVTCCTLPATSPRRGGTCKARDQRSKSLLGAI